MINCFVLAFGGRLLFHFRKFTTKNHRLNSYLFCADTKAALIFLAKASICQIFQKAGSLSLLIAPPTALEGLISAYALMKSHVYIHRQTETW